MIAQNDGKNITSLRLGGISWHFKSQSISRLMYLHGAVETIFRNIITGEPIETSCLLYD